MSESPQRLKHSVGTPFWIGCLVGPILFIIFSAALGIFQDSFTFWFFTGIAVIVFGPVGGMVSQAIHDLFVARRLRLLHVWDFLVFTAIAIALVVAGEALFHASGKQGVRLMIKSAFRRCSNTRTCFAPHGMEKSLLVLHVPSPTLNIAAISQTLPLMKNIKRRESGKS
jgi:hypothetical protein